jgi:hypothetical protein
LAAVTGLHVLTRLGPAVVLAGGRFGAPGEHRRLTALIVTLVIAVIAATLLLAPPKRGGTPVIPGPSEPRPGSSSRPRGVTGPHQ